VNTMGGTPAVADTRSAQGAGHGPQDRSVDPDRTAAVVLVGGQGSRLRPLTTSTPKPMLSTAGVPFLAHLLSRIAAVGIRRVVLGTAYRAEVFDAYLGDGSALGLELECVEEAEPMGTGGGIRNAATALAGSGHDEVMVFNGDILSGVDLTAVLAEHRAAGADATLHLVRVADPTAFGCVPTDATGRVEAFLEKTLNPPTDQVNAGCYVFRREVVEAIPSGRPVSVERETFPGLLRAGAGCRATSSRRTGSTSAPHRRSSAAVPTSCRASRRPRPCPARPGPR
jgi:mannose-1-phosphate guanylyltransferase